MNKRRKPQNQHVPPEAVLPTDTAPTFKTEAIGQAGEPVSFEVERERIAAYAVATNDSIPQHAAGDLAPPVFSIVPAFQSAAMASIGVIPPELIGSILHGEQDFHFHKPIEPGMVLESISTPIGMRQRSSGVTVVVRCETRDQAAELVTEQYMTSFVRGAQGAEDVGDGAPEHAFPSRLRDSEPVAEVAQTFDADQTFRYAEASGDPMQIHLDEEFAKAVGLPGIIIHGLCTMAFASVATLQSLTPDDPTRLRRLAVRFASIALPEQTITTKLWDAGEREGQNDRNHDGPSPAARTAYAFETKSDAGTVVIKDGWAEIA
ncbi:MAG: MaoC family dehydratase N-terminal domain-containing protein [Actinomycetota bacterium]|nr:MaoC family dehydratase N-terminal domain-containing protein [Actinomycetota bacterium]